MSDPEPPKRKPFFYDAAAREETLRRKARQAAHLRKWRESRGTDYDPVAYRRQRAEQADRKRRPK